MNIDEMIKVVEEKIKELDKEIKEKAQRFDDLMREGKEGFLPVLVNDSLMRAKGEYYAYNNFLSMLKSNKSYLKK